jgi:hypothetical protein
MSFLFPNKKDFEKQLVLCLNCAELKEKNLKRLNEQIAQLERGKTDLIIEELKRKKANHLERVSKIIKKIEACQNSSLISQVLFEKQKEKEHWEKRKIWETLKIGDGYSTQMCGCGCLVGYAPKKGREYGTKKFVSAKQNQKFLRDKREKEEQREFMESKKVEIKVIGQSKVARSLGHNDATIPERKDGLKEFEEAEKDAGER